MPQTQEAIFYQGDQLTIDHTPVSALAAGEIVQLGTNLSGICNVAIPAGKQGALDVGNGIGIYKIKKDAIDTFALGAIVDWDNTNNQAEPNGGANSSWTLGICVKAAIATDEFVLVRFEPAA